MTYLTQLTSTVEIDLYLQHMSTYLGISLQILWSTYNTHRENLRFRQSSKQVSEKVEYNKSSSPTEELMVFIIGMKHADFFRDEFLFFNHADNLADFKPVFDYLKDPQLDDEDAMRYELIFEQKYAHMDEKSLIESRTQMMKRLNQITFDYLQKTYSSQSGDMKMFQKLNELNEIKPKLFW